MAQEEDKSNLEARFNAAVRVIRSLPEDGPFQPSDDMMLMFYSYYKQATLGPSNIPRPTGFWDTRGKAKWDAWSSLGNMTKEEAMINYVDDIQLILETIPISDEVSDLVEKLGTFYAEVEGGGEDEENVVEKRPFTRPFTREAEVLPKPTMEGFGGLWEDIQNTTEKPKEIHVNGMADSSKEKESKMERREESSESEMEEEEEQVDGDDEDDDDEEEEEEERERRSLDPRRLRVDGRRWRSGTWGSSSSVEPSLSSLTNGTHSSLNSEEEEELACSIEPCVKNNPYSHLNGHLSDHSDVILEKNHRATDSDNEEFCDSMEHLAMEEVSGAPSKVFSSGSRTASVRRKDLWGETKVTLNGEEHVTSLGDPRLGVGLGTVQTNSSLSRRGRGSQSPRPVACGSQPCVDVEAECYCVTQSRNPRGVSRGNVNEQIAMALLRLQEDMSHVLHRLHTLEVLAVSQSRSPSPRPEDTLPLVRKLQRPSWWPFHLSPITVILTTAWPLVAHWLVQFYLQRKRRKIS